MTIAYGNRWIGRSRASWRGHVGQDPQAVRAGSAVQAAGELAHASDVMMAHPLALQLRNLETLVEISVDKNSTVVFPAPLMSTIQELGAFLSREATAVNGLPVPPVVPATTPANGAAPRV